MVTKIKTKKSKIISNHSPNKTFAIISAKKSIAFKASCLEFVCAPTSINNDFGNAFSNLMPSSYLYTDLANFLLAPKHHFLIIYICHLQT